MDDALDLPWQRDTPAALMLASAVVIAAVFATLAYAAELPVGTFLALGAVAGAALPVDIRERIIPDALSLPALVAAGGGAAAWSGWGAVGVGLACAAAVFAFLLALALPGWVGGGDVKFAPAFALAFGAYSWQSAGTWLWLAMALFVAAELSARAAGRGREGRPFMPQMVIAAVLVLSAEATLAWLGA